MCYVFALILISLTLWSVAVSCLCIDTDFFDISSVAVLCPCIDVDFLTGKCSGV